MTEAEAMALKPGQQVRALMNGKVVACVVVDLPWIDEYGWRMRVRRAGLMPSGLPYPSRERWASNVTIEPSLGVTHDALTKLAAQSRPPQAWYETTQEEKPF